MHLHDANGDTRFPFPDFWPRVREFAVPASVIETATARRRVGDWAGACAAAGFDVDLDLAALGRRYGRELAAGVRADLRHLAPDLLRWHMPRIAPDGLLRPGLTVPLARYGPVHLVVRTAPAWADGGQRISLTLWDGDSVGAEAAARHPHPRPSRRFRFDLHRHLWDARRAGELRERSGACGPPLPDAERWAAEARILLAAEGRDAGPVAVRAGERRFVLDVGPSSVACLEPDGRSGPLPLLPDAATWLPPDLELLRTGAIEAGRLHPLVAAALVPGHVGSEPVAPPDPRTPRLVECRGALHRIALVDGVLAPMDHDPDELRREELLVALSGTPLPCLRIIDEAHRRPDGLDDVRERLRHGDTAGALAAVEGLLGPEAVLRSGPLQDALRAAAERRLVYGLYRAGLAGPAYHQLPARPSNRRPRRTDRARPRHAFR
ncbi:hypothetical protein RGF97_13820 [Streptomyces roseicoloratus]|uniref:Uncharacterized protein n=1 Tax=Streptomyces roseicoloratus TaxID=2508722 RepID=A0ABY9RU64_9ACTN|nr:hypothetical protein [Streptomyces roseicoloratus]WMX45715.1 hypothetical protein RGF97_13820 [Streptomyces roseicoloratus]